MTIRTYRDPVQERLTQIFNSTSKSDLDEVRRIVTDLARRRLFALPLDLTPLRDACRWAIEDLSLRGMPEAAGTVAESLEQLVEAALNADHPLRLHADSWRERTVLVPDDLLDELLQEDSWIFRSTTGILLPVSEWRAWLDAPGPSAELDDWLQAAHSARQHRPALLLGWPSNYYLRHWFENHAWLWFAPIQTIHLPVGLNASLAPRLWVSSAHDPSAGWARTLNARMRRQAAAATRGDAQDEKTQEEMHRVYSGNYSHSEYVDVLAYGVDQGGHGWTRRFPSYNTQLWDPDARELRTLHFAPGTAIDEPAILIHFGDREPWEVNRDLGSWANPLSLAVAAWKRAAASALAAGEFQTDRTTMRAVASGKQIRVHGTARNETLYRDLARFGDDEFRRLFPDFPRTQRLLRKWHAAQSLGGKEGVKHLESALATLGPDAPEVTRLVQVVHCSRLEFAALSGGLANG